MTLTARARLLVAVAGVVLLGVACVPLLDGPEIPASEYGPQGAGIQCRSIADGTESDDYPLSQSVSREEVLGLDGSDLVHEDSGLPAPGAAALSDDPDAFEQDQAVTDLAARAARCPDARITNLVVAGALVVPAVLLLAVALLAASAPPPPGGRERLPYRYMPMGRRDADR